MIAKVLSAFGMKVRNMRHHLGAVLLFSALLCLSEAQAKAAEGGIGTYLMSMPLGIDSSVTTAAAGKSIKAKF